MRLPTNSIKAYRLLVLGIILTLAGCCTTKPLKGRADLLAFLADGKTTKAQVVLSLGQPSSQFEGEKIFTYQLGFEKKNKGYYVVEPSMSEDGWRAWGCVKYSLVLVFDGQGLLVRHSLVEVN